MRQTGACYIRVSTEEQTEFSPDAQLKAIRVYAQANGIRLAEEHIYIDEGVSGKRADKRPQFQRMVAQAKRKPRPFDVILVHRFDRFARSREDSVVYKSLLRKEAGVRVVSITENIEDDKFSVILEAMLEAMAEYYSLNLADEVKKGMREKAERGGLQTAAAFGYRAVGGQLTPFEEEARWVRFLFEQFAARAMSVRQLAEYLNGAGVKTRQGGPFERRAVEYILRNPVYIGKLRWTPSGRARRDYSRPDTIVRDGGHEPLVDAEIWECVQDVFTQRQALAPARQPSRAAPPSWLRGLVCCGNCGRALVRSKRRYLQCNGYAKGVCGTSCSVRASVLEALVAEQLAAAFPHPLIIRPKDAGPAPGEGERALLEGRLEQLDAKARRVREAYQSGVDTLSEYRQAKAELAGERESIARLLAQLAPAAPAAQGPLHFVNIGALLADEAVSPLLKNRAAAFLIRRITCTRQTNELRIEYYDSPQTG